MIFRYFSSEHVHEQIQEESLRVEKTHLTSSSSGPVGRLSKRAGILRRTKGGVNVRGASAGPLLGSSVQALDLSVAGGHSPPSAAIHDGKVRRSSSSDTCTLLPPWVREDRCNPTVGM